MKIVMLGTGYVGLVSGACFSEFGYQVICVDNDKEKINNLENGILPIYEPGLEALVTKNFKNGKLRFSSTIENSISEADAIFIAVGTPERRGDGHADLSYVYSAAKEIAPLLKRYCLSDHFFTTNIGMIKDKNFIYRVRSKKNSLFWWKYRHIKANEILSSNHQMEQWLWSNLLKNNFSINLDISYREYINYLSKYFLIIPTWQIGYFWTRSSSFYLHNWVKFASEGHDLLRTTMPFRNFISCCSSYS